jgi:cation transport ATPase
MDRRARARKPFCNHGRVSEHSESTEQRRHEDDHEADHEEARRAVARRRNAISWAVIAWVTAAALALLGYDAATAALGDHGDGRPWAYPAAVTAICAISLIALASWSLRHLRRR